MKVKIIKFFQDFMIVFTSFLFLFFFAKIFLLGEQKESHKNFSKSNINIDTLYVSREIKSEFSLSLIGRGTSYETPYYIFDSGNSGPVVLVEAGIHGDEMAGTYALDKLVYKIKIREGKLILIPRMNILACQENKRYINKDLNRVFSKDSKGTFYEYPLAKEIYELIGTENISYLLTLHESNYLHDPEQSKSYGQTIVYGVKPMPTYLPDWIESINRGKEQAKDIFYPYYSPVEGSSTETLVEAYNLKGGFCIETWKGFPIEKRIGLQTDVVLSFFEIINLRYSMNENTFQH